jgi:hypothetical protein
MKIATNLLSAVLLVCIITIIMPLLRRLLQSPDCPRDFSWHDWLLHACPYLVATCIKQ